MPYCSKCGAELPEDTKFCPSCGQAAGEAPEAKRKGEKGEKHEKHEKEEKGEKHEKHEKEEGDRSGALMGGLILILLGSILILSDAGMIPEPDIWAYFMWGIGVILLLGAAWKYASGYKASATGLLFGGLILCAIGASGIMGFEQSGAIVIIVVGIVVIAWGIQTLRRSPKPP